MERMVSVLQHWLEADWIRAVDLQFAKQLLALTDVREPQEADTLLLLMVLLSHQVGRGHVCIELDSLWANPEQQLAIPPPDKRYAQARLPAKRAAEEYMPSRLLQSITANEAIELLNQHQLANDGSDVYPLVVSSGRLYMRRYWLYEVEIASAIRQRLTLRPGMSDPASETSVRLRQTLNNLFGVAKTLDYQRIACALAARSRFSLITGGPGTGKTTTVIRLLALLQSLAKLDPVCGSGRYRIELAAPTGKAAARLNESIRSAIDSIEPQLAATGLSASDLPNRVRTLHRLLGSRRLSREFRHNSDNPLPLDVLVIDEASMVDVGMLAALVSALPRHAQLILIGDQDQLASVEAGSVLGELSARSREGHYLPQTNQWLHQVTGSSLPEELTDHRGQALDQAVAMLRQSYRFDLSSGIGQLAQAINNPDALTATVQGCISGAYDDINFLKPAKLVKGEHKEALLQQIEAQAVLAKHGSESKRVGYAAYLQLLGHQKLTETTPADVRNRFAQQLLQAYGRFQLLTPLRQGDFGVTELNRRIQQHLHHLGLIDSAQEWYQGRPVMVSANDYNIGLMNGDVGICLHVDDRPLVAFMPAEADEPIRWIPPSRLPAHETVFAMTVHKSQGSEFEHCALVIPPQDSSVLTAELVYTAVTRARRWFTLLSNRPEALLQIAQRRTERASGLGMLLFNQTDGEPPDKTEVTSINEQLGLF